MQNNLTTLLQNINYARRRNLKEKRSASEIKENANLMNEYLREINRKRKPLSPAAQEWNPSGQTRAQRKYRKQSRKSRNTRKSNRR
jgi:hypothetical protein